jgi:hypothetical protein
VATQLTVADFLASSRTQPTHTTLNLHTNVSLDTIFRDGLKPDYLKINFSFFFTVWIEIYRNSFSITNEFFRDSFFQCFSVCVWPIEVDIEWEKKRRE